MDERNVRKENLASSHSRYSQSLAIIQQLGLDRGKRRYYQRGRTWTAKLMSRYNFHRLQEFEKIPSGRKSPRRSIGRLFPVPVGWAISMFEFFFPSRASIKTSTWKFYCNRMSRQFDELVFHSINTNSCLHAYYLSIFVHSMCLTHVTTIGIDIFHTGIDISLTNADD